MQAKETALTIFLGGDVMTGRGIDQILPHPSNPRIFERYMKNARGYLALAESASGPIQFPVDYSYVWGDSLAFLQSADLRIVNLETAVTTSEERAFKGINYRMHPLNMGAIQAARIDCCLLANNHVLDWGKSGLVETLDCLAASGVKQAGAGVDATTAASPAILEVAEKGRVLVIACAAESSGVTQAQAARMGRPGVNWLPDFSDISVRRIAGAVEAAKRPGDIVVFSIHWGGNWGYEIAREQVEFAHRLIDEAGVDLIHGHSSHHVKAIEVYRGKLILYGAGDLINDYEGIRGYEAYRSDLGLMYFARVDCGSGQLLGLEMIPTRINKFRIGRAGRESARWLRLMLNREGQRFGTRARQKADNRLRLEWGGS